MTGDARAWPTGLIEVAPATYAYVQATGAAGICNAGLLLGPDQAIVIDSLATPEMNMGFLRSIRSVTALPFSHLLITHHHVDHVLGIQFFLPTQVVCHSGCREEMVLAGPDTPLNWVKMRPQFANKMDGVRICYPNITIDGNMTFYLGDREVQVFHPGLAHSRGDLMIHLPQERVLFASDIAFFKVAPQPLAGHVGKWIKAMDRVLEMDVDTIVPGHGPIGGKAEMTEARDCLATVYEGARRCFEKGMTEQEAVAAIDLGTFADWANPERYPDCVRKAYQEFREGPGD